MGINNMEDHRHNGGAGQIDRFSFVATHKVNHGFLVNGQMREEPVEFTIQVSMVIKCSYLPSEASLKLTSI